MSVSFNGIGEQLVTFKAGTVAAGRPVTLNGNNTVRNAASGVAPIGVARNVRNDHAAVQLKGYLEIPYTGTAPALGFNDLVTDSTGGLRVATETESGRTCLVVKLDATNKTIGLFL